VAEHRGQPPADAASVEPVLLLGCECGEDLLALAVAEHADVEFVVMTAEVDELGLLRMAGPAVQRVDDRCGAAAGVREPLRGAGAEVEQHLHAVTAVHLEVALLLLLADVGLAEEDGIAAAALEELHKRAQVGDRPVLGVGADRLDHELQRVDPEPGDAEFQPESEDLVHLVQDVRVGDVQIGHEVEVPVHVPLACGFVIGPGALLLAGKRYFAGLFLLGVAPAVVVPVPRAAVAARLLEPGMLAARMAEHEVDQHPDAEVVRGADHLDEIPQRSETGIDRVVVGDVVAVVA
jgi:hypothetical protein